MNRQDVFNEFQNIEGIKLIKNKDKIKAVLDLVWKGLQLDDIRPKLDTLDTMKKYIFSNQAEFGDKRIKESQMTDIESCIVNCEREDIGKAVLSLDNFIAPFKSTLDKPFSDFEKLCIKFMITNIRHAINRYESSTLQSKSTSAYFHPTKGGGVDSVKVWNCRIAGKCQVASPLLFAIQMALDELEKCNGDSDVIAKLKKYIEVCNSEDFGKV
jgi:hypothetical protein